MGRGIDGVCCDYHGGGGVLEDCQQHVPATPRKEHPPTVHPGGETRDVVGAAIVENDGTGFYEKLLAPGLRECMTGKPAPPAPGILAEAQQLVAGARQKAYDHPSTNYKRVAQGWAVLVNANNGVINAKTAALMMIWLKMTREAHATKRDNLVDIAGYAQVASIIQGYEDL